MYLILTGCSFKNSNGEPLLDARRCTRLWDSGNRQDEKQPEPRGTYIRSGKTLIRCSLGGKDFQASPWELYRGERLRGEVGEIRREQPQQVRRDRGSSAMAAAARRDGDSIDGRHPLSAHRVPARHHDDVASFMWCHLRGHRIKQTSFFSH